MADAPLLSVVIPCCNGEKHLPDCLRSLERQTLREFEVIVVENGSEDRTREIVRDEFPWVKLIVLDGKQGFSKPVNTGCAAARAPWLFVLNDDTVCHDDCLSRLLAGVAAHPEADFFGALMLYYDDPAKVQSGGHGLASSGAVYEDYAGDPAAEFTEPLALFGVCAGAALYRASVFAELGGFDEDFHIINEDVDFDFRLQNTGRQGFLLPDAKVLHRVSQFMGTGSPRMIHAYLKNRCCYLVKSVPPQFWRDNWREILHWTLIDNAGWIRKGYGGPLVRAHWDFARLAARMLRKRRAQSAAMAEHGQRVVDWIKLPIWDARRQPQPPAATPPPPAPARERLSRELERVVLGTLTRAVALPIMAPFLACLPMMWRIDHPGGGNRGEDA